MNIEIFVEGKHDKEFLEQYLKFLGYSDAKIISCGRNTIYGDIISKIKEFKDDDKKVLLIFDADSDFNTTLNRLIQESLNLLENKDIFLFPNNYDNGELETLLFKIAKEKQICECFKQYKKCIQKYNEKYINNINKKSMRYAYFEALGLSLSDNSKEKEQRKEAYKEIFDLNSKYLEPFKNFLQNHFNL
ncbi:DUF3226 domain-containing protein [Campylobacter sp. GB48]|uniref:DUF3226 domain-containing protein n=1 Tax=Campylobacter sp. GB48 TaxID=3400423 RepID=UPI003B9B6491